VTVPQKSRYLRYASSFVIAEYDQYAAYGTRDSGILRICSLDLGFLRNRPECNFQEKKFASF